MACPVIIIITSLLAALAFDCSCGSVPSRQVFSNFRAAQAAIRGYLRRVITEGLSHTGVSFVSNLLLILCKSKYFTTYFIFTKYFNDLCIVVTSGDMRFIRTVGKKKGNLN